MNWTREQVEEAIEILGRHKTVKKAAKEMGVTRSSLRHALQRFGFGSPNEYLLRGDEWTFAEEAEPDDGEEDEPYIKIPKIEINGRHQIIDGVYMFYPRKADAFGLPEEVVNAFKRKLANPPNGPGWTYNKVAQHFGIGRRELEFIARELRWTKDQDEFTRNEHLNSSTAQLIQDREMRSRWLLQQEADRREKAELKRLAKIGEDFTARTKILAEVIQDFCPLDVPLDLSLQRVESDRCHLLTISDCHLGQPDDSGSYRALWSLLYGLDLSEHHVVLSWMGDLFHTDTPQHTTTAGTRQEVKTYSPLAQMKPVYQTVFAVNKYVAEQAASFENVVIAGNHDEMATAHLMCSMEQMGLPIDDQGDNPLKAVVWNRELFLFEHGDGIRGQQSLLNTAYHDFRHLLGETDRSWLYTGHLHHLKQLDVAGSVITQVASAASDSRWEKKKGYRSMRSMQAFEFEAGRGLIRIHNEIVL